MNALSVNASIILTQTNPDAPAFMTVCALIDDDIHTYSAIIHSFGEVAQNGKICQSFGPHYNPFGVSVPVLFHVSFQLSFCKGVCVQKKDWTIKLLS